MAENTVRIASCAAECIGVGEEWIVVGGEVICKLWDGSIVLVSGLVGNCEDTSISA